MSAVEKNVHPVKIVSKNDVRGKRPSEAIAARRSKELVIAFAGPIGSGIRAVKDRFSQLLSDAGYDVRQIKISEYLEKCIAQDLVQKGRPRPSDKADRYIQLQEAGNELRKAQTDILAEYAISRIAEVRTEEIKEEIKDVTDHIPRRTAYLIDQLKHQDEVSLLRALYGNLFYLFGVLSTSARRSNRLKADGVAEDRISELVERDRKQREKNGQQLDKALQLADFFIRNDHANADALEFQIKRSIDLIHGLNGISPTREEYGMYVAYASGLRSACLSRQIGASIMDNDGLIISTGRNDVPKAGGGLYGPEDGKSDARCVKLEGGQCYNDLYKRNLVKDIEGLISGTLRKTLADVGKDATEDQKAILEKIGVAEISTEIANSAHDDTRLGGLIEFSRSIHAEMDAIVSLAFKGGGIADGATLFTYTFPCHNCARHIVAAGIRRVYYLEPYEKSLAVQLHGDAINVDGQRGGLGDGAEGGKRVEFLHFEGVAPRQYLSMFALLGERKDDNGKAVKTSVRDAEKKIPEYLDDYREYELKVVEHLSTVINELKERGLPAVE
ncbi:MAG: anti-phage dCTP deaminase [Burkholderiales bacterium]|jgi:deoxycytidylate deaminase